MSATAEFLPLVSRSEGRIAFKVDDVEPVTSRLETAPVLTTMARWMKRRLLVSSADVSVVANEFAEGGLPWSRLHPFVHAVHRAFNEHRPLELIPDDFAIIIAQGVAHHIHTDPEKYRYRLVSHEGKHRLLVKTDRFSTREDWEVIIGCLSDMLRESANPEMTDVLRCDYSTTTPAIRVAAEIAMLEAFNRYFDYMVLGICGIPEITLHGTPADWERLLRRAEKLAALDLDWWTARLLPILHELLATAAGYPRAAFWKAICKPREAYGSGVITGWITDLFPYLSYKQRNKSLEWPRVRWALSQEPESDAGRIRVRGVSPGDFPNGVAETAFQFGPTEEETRTCMLAGGFLGVEQTPGGSLRTHIGWTVLEGDDIDRILDRVGREAQTIPASKDPIDHTTGSVPAFMMAFSKRFYSAVLFPGGEHEWKLGLMGKCTDGEKRYQVFGLRRDRVVLAVRFKSMECIVCTGRIADTESFRNASPAAREYQTVKNVRRLGMELPGR